MPSLMTFDEINSLYRKGRRHKVLPIERYFGEMELSKAQKEERIGFAKDFEKELFPFLALIWLYYGLNRDTSAIVRDIADAYIKIVNKYTVADSYILQHSEEYSRDFVDTTLKYAKKIPENQKDAYWLSDDRARMNAENESNVVFNHDDYRLATSDGKTRKRWRTMKDERVRDTHYDVDDVIIPIDALFHVGHSLMLYPLDKSHGADDSEIINCRCTIKYL